MPDAKNHRPSGDRPAGGISNLSVGIWLASGLFHLVLLFLLSQLPMMQGTGGNGGGGTGEGLVIKAQFLGGSSDSGEAGDPESGVAEDESAGQVELVSISPTPTEALEPPPEEEPESDVSPESVADDRPEVPMPTTRSRSSPRSVPTKEAEHSARIPSRAIVVGVTANGRGSGHGVVPGHGHSGSTGDGQGTGTTFFDVPGRGSRFVYVIDRSSSMEQKHRFDAARAELLASLRELPSTALVEVIFYNDTAVWLSAGEKPTLTRNTPMQQRKFTQFAASIQPDGGTNHMQALQLALQAGPDAIFLLTDADEPKLHAGDLDRIVRANRRRTTIHAIELGVGALLDADNFLMRLARQNRGTYRYWDIERLSGTEELPPTDETADR